MANSLILLLIPRYLLQEPKYYSNSWNILLNNNIDNLIRYFFVLIHSCSRFGVSRKAKPVDSKRTELSQRPK